MCGLHTTKGDLSPGGDMIYLSPFMATTIAGTWASAVDNNSFLNFACTNNAAAANGDEINWTVMIPTGTYTLKQIGIEANDRPKIDVYIDGTKVVNAEDWYAGAPAWNVEKTTTSIAVSNPTNKLLTIRLVCNGKNALSGGYSHYFLGIWLMRTA